MPVVLMKNEVQESLLICRKQRLGVLLPGFTTKVQPRNYRWHISRGSRTGKKMFLAQ